MGVLGGALDAGTAGSTRAWSYRLLAAMAVRGAAAMATSVRSQLSHRSGFSRASSRLVVTSSSMLLLKGSHTSQSAAGCEQITPSTLASSGEVRSASKAARRSACGRGQRVKAASLESTARRAGSAQVFRRRHAPESDCSTRVTPSSRRVCPASRAVATW